VHPRGYDVEPVRTVLRWGLESRVFPAASIEVGCAGHPLWREAFGRLSYDDGAPAAAPDTRFDLASLTKVIVTATVAMDLSERGRVDIDAPVASVAEDWRGHDRAAVTLRDLLEHASGLPGWLPLHRTCRGRDAFRRALASMPLAYEPRSRSEYSDLGFILLGFILEDLGGAPLDTLFAALVPSGAVGLRFRPAAGGRRAALAPTRAADERGPLEPGDVDDTNAWALGGVAAHAGLFGTADAVGAFARAVLAALDGAGRERGGLAAPDTVRRFVRPSSVPGSSRALAWDTMRATSSCGTRMSPRAIGHTGFTGTSLWIDPAADRYVVLLTNRVHPEAHDAESIQAVRRGVHDAVMDAMR
jgi:CubicO group peptidase (beta-lactamase class C family)